MNRQHIDELVTLLYPNLPGPDGADGGAQRGEAGALPGRRSFLRTSAVLGGGVVFAMYAPGCGKKTEKTPDKDVKPVDPDPTAAPDLPVTTQELNAFVEISSDNTVTVTIPKSEMGQGVRTSLALLVAEEMDLAWDRVKVAQAHGDAKKYGRQGTGGSGSIRRGWKPLREAGAKARAMLVAAAAQKLGVPAESLATENSQVIHAESGREVPYGDLAALVVDQEAPEIVAVKEPDQFRLLGKEYAGIDVPDIVRGEARYGMDIRMPGQLFASIERAPVFGGEVASFDADAAKAVPGVKHVVQVPAQGGDVNVHHGVAVVAENTWAAMQGRAKLNVKWKDGPHASETSDDHRKKMDQFVAKKGGELVNKLGDPDKVLARRAKDVHRSEYSVPFIAHATMEPMNCTAEVKDGKCRVWGPTQFPNWAAGSIAKTLEMPVENVRVEISLLGGGFGRRINPDFAVEAALVASKIAEAGDAVPVQVVWTREDDMTHDFYRPPAKHRIEAVLDKDGYPEAWRQRMTTPAIMATIDPTAKEFGVGESNGASDMLYRVPNRSCEYTHLPSGVTRGWWRGVHTTHTTFAVESFIDELAEKAGKDPLEYRLHLIDELQVDRPEPDKEFPWDPKRLQGVLKLAAEKAGWGKPVPEGHGVGIACGIDHLSYGAQVVEVSLENGALRIHRVVCAADCGPVVNMDGARAQIEGGIVHALSSVLGERITIAGGRVEQKNFDTYQILRINQTPVVIEAHFAPTKTHPTGLGEPSVPPLAPALANAIYRVTGKRIRDLPMSVALQG